MMDTLDTPLLVRAIGPLVAKALVHGSGRVAALFIPETVAWVRSTQLVKEYCSRISNVGIRAIPTAEEVRETREANALQNHLPASYYLSPYHILLLVKDNMKKAYVPSAFHQEAEIRAALTIQMKRAKNMENDNDPDDDPSPGAGLPQVNCNPVRLSISRFNGGGGSFHSMQGVYRLFITEMWERFNFYLARGISPFFFIIVIMWVSYLSMGRMVPHVSSLLTYEVALVLTHSIVIVRILFLRSLVMHIRRSLFVDSFNAMLKRNTHMAGINLQIMFGFAVHQGRPTSFKVETRLSLVMLRLLLERVGNGFFKPNIWLVPGNLWFKALSRVDSRCVVVTSLSAPEQTSASVQSRACEQTVSKVIIVGFHSKTPAPVHSDSPEG